MGVTTGGWQGTGSFRPTKGRIGIILTTITIVKAGDGMKATGIVRTTTGIANTATITMITIIDRRIVIVDHRPLIVGH
jgi:hypothetical protein